MPRQKRVEFEGAIYHVMAKGNRESVIVEDDVDREYFVNTLSELIERTGWELFAWVLMDDHYHMVVRTPEANLIEGMTWFQSTFTKRCNGRHKMSGHLFAGRYETHVVEEGQPLRTVIDFVHLNPLRSECIAFEQLVVHPWGSVSDYFVSPNNRRSFMDVTSGMKSIKIADTKKGRDRYWKSLQEVSGSESDKLIVKNDWVVGSDQFLDEVTQLLEIGLEDIKNGYGGAQLRGVSEITARKIIAEQLEELGMTEKAFKKLPKSDEIKVRVAHEIRQKTNMTLPWIVEELSMGTASTVTKTIQAWLEQQGEDVEELYDNESLEVHLL